MVQTTEKLSVFLTWFPYFDHDLDIEQLQSADITVYTAGDPYAPGRSQTEFIQETDVFRGIFPAIDLEGAKVAHEQIMNETLEAEIIVSPEVKKTIASGEFAPIFREQLQTDRLTVLSVERSMPFYVGLSDGTAIQIGVADDDGMPRALLESSDGTLREWAEGQYQEYRSEAQIVSPHHFA
nr:hypothetical protein [Natrarchaeobius chitinivorans]